MLLRVTSNHHITIPAHLLDAMGVDPADRLELFEMADGYLLRPRRIDYSRLKTPRVKIPDSTPLFDIRVFRDNPYNPALRQ